MNNRLRSVLLRMTPSWGTRQRSFVYTGLSMRHDISRNIIKLAMWLAIVPLAAACNVSRDHQLLDGCYFLGEQRILKLQGTEGNLFVPGDISRFRLIPQGSSDYIWMTTQPGFVLGGRDPMYVRSVGSSPTPSPVILIEDTSPAASRILVRYNGQIVRLVRQDSCAETPTPRR